MTIILIHGNPETAEVWSHLVDALGEADVVRLSPPGFGAPVPPAWIATPRSYRDWLVGELETFGGPVDVVGHDWGGAHVVNVAMTRPDLLRSWCTDSIGMFDPDFTWHALARTWQESGTGEEAVVKLTASTVEQRAAYLASIGVPAAIAAVLAPGCADVSAQAIIELYRAARQPQMSNLGRQLPAAGRRPGLVLLATEDAALGTDAMRRRSAARAGASVERLPGLGHWWMLQDPALAATLLHRFWSSLPS